MLNIRRFTQADVPFGMSLCGPAGWNQLEEDWRRAVSLQPDGCFLAEWENTPVGTTTTCLFGDVAWIAMVLVAPSHRGRGIGTALMRQALQFLDFRQVRSIWLDATPLGRPIYQKLGFEMEATFLRYAGIPQVGEMTAESHVSCIRKDLLSQALTLDLSVYGYDRSALLMALPELHAARAWHDGERLRGFCLWRRGARAWKVGPCLADGDCGPALLQDALRSLAREPVYVDVPDTNVAAAAIASQAGLEVQRPLYRMRRGITIPWQSDAIWSTFGPEKG